MWFLEVGKATQTKLLYLGWRLVHITWSIGERLAKANRKPRLKIVIIILFDIVTKEDARFFLV